MNIKLIPTIALPVSLILFMGAGCSSTTTTNTNVTVDTNTDAAGGTVLANSNANVGADDTVNTNTTSDITADTNATVDVGDDTIEDVEDVVTSETKTFDITASQFSFSPSTITVNQGDHVVLNLTTSDVPHGFSLSNFGVSATITPGQTKTVEFDADETGSFTFSCTVVCGSGHSGMKGTLVVE